MARLLILAFDVVNQAYVGNYNGSAQTLPNLRQGLYQTKIYLVKPAANAIAGQAQYTFFDASAYDGLRVGGWQNSTGTLGDEDANVLFLTDQTGWTYDQTDPANPFWSGTLNTYTTQVADWIGAATNKAAYFAVNLITGTDLNPVFDQRGGTNMTLYSATDGGGGAPINMTGQVPTLLLPLRIKNPDTGHIFQLAETNDVPPTLQWTCINP